MSFVFMSSSRAEAKVRMRNSAADSRAHSCTQPGLGRWSKSGLICSPMMWEGSSPPGVLAPKLKPYRLSP